jgi:hypothetical protein
LAAAKAQTPGHKFNYSKERFRIVAECLESARKNLAVFCRHAAGKRWSFMLRNVPIFAPTKMLIWIIDIGKPPASN